MVALSWHAPQNVRMKNRRRRARLHAVVAAPLALAAAALTAVAAHADDCIPIDNFTSSKPGEFPADWKVRKDAGKSAYTVQEEAGTRFLHAQAASIGQQAARQFDKWNLDEYPILAWRWRPVEFPKGGDERTSANDSALAVYFLVPYSNIRGPRALKYVWSEKVPVGTDLESNMGLTKVRVLRSGTPADAKAWTEERIDVRADFLKRFAQTEVPKPGGIAVLTDSDDTSSRAQGDYADFRACRK
jgi:hypothetical protein